MTIRTTLILVYGALAICFSTLFSSISVVRITENTKDNAVKMESTLRRGLEKFLSEKAHALAGQIEIYLRPHPLDVRNPELLFYRSATENGSFRGGVRSFILK